MNNYKTLSDAINGLKKRGYTEDLNLQPTCTECPSYDLLASPEDFKIDEFYRFEGMSNPSDNSIVYAVSSKSGVKGVLVDAYGVYAEGLDPTVMAQLEISR